MSALALIACLAVAGVGRAGTAAAVRLGMAHAAAWFWCAFVLAACWAVFLVVRAVVIELGVAL